MKQFYFFIFTAMFTALCKMIDVSFGNNVSIDAVCVLTSYEIITWISHSIYSVGSYGYRISLRTAKSCLFVQCIIAGCTGLVVFGLHNIIPHVYHLTNAQYNMFSDVLLMHAWGIPFLAIGDFLSQYLKLKCKNKLLWISNTIYYVMMISLDALVIGFHLDLHYLIVTTNISYIVYDIIVFFGSSILQEQIPVNLTDMKQCIMHGYRIVVDRLFGKIAVIVFAIYASKLNTLQYAIHGVCYAIVCKCEELTDAGYDFQIVKLQTISDFKQKYNTMRYWMKKTYIPISMISVLFGIFLMILSHGSVRISDCWLFVLLYLSEMFLIQSYENRCALLTSMQETRYLMFGGLIGSLVRVPVVLISYYSGIGLYGFAFASGLDFLGRAAYFQLCIKHVLNCKDQIEKSDLD